MNNPTFYQVSFFINGIITDGSACCYFKADTEEEAKKQFFKRFSHIDVYGMSIKRVLKNTSIYKTLTSLHDLL